MKPILEQVVFDKAQSISAFQYEKSHFEMPWHFHPQHELTFIEESVGTKFIGDYVGPYEPGELVLVRSNLPHCWKNHIESNGISRSIVIQWNKGIYAKAPELQTLFTMLQVASRGVLFNKEQASILKPRIKNLIHLDQEELYLELLLVLVSLSKLEFTLLSQSSFVDDLPETYSTRMTKVNDFVAKEYYRKIYLRELATLVNMTEQSFSRFFSKMMGRPFFAYLNEYRINMAARKLIDTDASISQIGFASGYESLPFFFKKFAEVHRTSPKQYRNKFKEV